MAELSTLTGSLCLSNIAAMKHSESNISLIHYLIDAHCTLPAFFFVALSTLASVCLSLSVYLIKLKCKSESCCY